MIDLALNGVVLRVKEKMLGNVGDISVMGKTLTEWAGSSMRAKYTAVESSPVVNMSERIQSVIDRKKPVTIVLFCDTPLISPKTIAAAVKRLTDEKSDYIALPRGYVFKTEYLFGLDSLYFQDKPSDGEFDAVKDAAALSRITDDIRRRILRFHAERGVMIADMNNTYIDCDAIIEQGVTIEPYNFIKGKTIIRSGAHILPGNYIQDCVILSGARIDSSRLYNSSVGENTTVGPFAYIRPDSAIGAHCRIGDFVELKNCVIGDGTKISHLTYVGDAQLGNDCNVGCGVVFANYDGKNKYKSVVGNRVFIGSNANIVAPVEIADRAFIAAGSTITRSVPEQGLAVARARQTLIPNWQGNVYAPPPPAGAQSANPSHLVQFDDGIIDGTGAKRAEMPSTEVSDDSGNKPE